MFVWRADAPCRGGRRAPSVRFIVVLSVTYPFEVDHCGGCRPGRGRTKSGFRWAESCPEIPCHNKEPGSDMRNLRAKAPKERLQKLRKSVCLMHCDRKNDHGRRGKKSPG